MKTVTESFKAAVFPMALMEQRTNSGATWIDGCVITPTALIWVYTQDGTTRLDVVVNGRHIMRTISRRYTKRGLVTVAARFARELARKKSADAAITAAGAV